MEHSVIHDFSAYQMPALGFYESVQQRGYKHTRAGSVETTAKLADLSEFLDNARESRINTGEDNSDYIWFAVKEDDVLVYIVFNEWSIYIETASETYERAREVYSEIKEQIPKIAKPPSDETYIYFWSQGSHGPMSVRRRISVPAWSEIDGNYTAPVNNELGRLMEGHATELLQDGQLILWQGAPGTGKTYALRALAREWREWCDFHFITDPDQFFGSASYMMQVILRPNTHAIDVLDGDTVKERWNLLILEDSGELLAADAKQQVGQSLSRLLNLVDGMIGQGLRIVVLVTTNEELNKLHDAVSRHGRCASRLSFEELDAAEAQQWIEKRANGSSPSITSHKSIADLYAILNGVEDLVQEKAFGFGS